MTCQRGDVVLYNAGYVDKSGTKIRSMLVVQNDVNNGRMQNTRWFCALVRSAEAFWLVMLSASI